MLIKENVKTNKKRVLIVTPYWDPANLGGAEKINQEIAYLLKANNYDVTVLTSNSFGVRYFRDLLNFDKINKNENRDKDLKLIRLDHNPLKAVFFFIVYTAIFPLIGLNNPFFRGPLVEKKALERILLKGNFDFIYCSPVPLNLIKQTVELTKNINDKKMILIIRPEFKKNIRYFHNKHIAEVLKKADIIHVTTNAEKRDLVFLFNLNPKKIVKIPHFLDMKKVHPLKTLSRKVREFKCKHSLIDKKIILFVGTKSADKGLLTLFKAIGRLFKKDKSYRLVTIGNDTKEWIIVKTFSKKDFLIDFNYIKGIEKETIFASCNVFCMPSKNDSFGIVYLEAWHKKKPVIGAKIESTQEIIEKNKGGLCVEFGNVGALINAIERLIDKPNLSSKYGEKGNAALIKHYTLEKNTKTILSLFSQKYEKN